MCLLIVAFEGSESGEKAIGSVCQVSAVRRSARAMSVVVVAKIANEIKLQQV